jgi:hypothetical protein
MKGLELMTCCVLFALACVAARAVIDTWAWGHCVAHHGGLSCRVFKNDAGISWGAAGTLALGIAYRRK